jgi:hypothetical protein
MNTMQIIYFKINYFFNYLFDILTMTPTTRYECIAKEDDDEEIIYINEHMIIER